ncbi:SWIM zinc finger family protein [Planctomicrobium sp. SH664]|uniref:SWIM zinc finger family protein n=1 Tax=Planctomicrobium sp. SH664 TaxID=3448125 RepID=UPI003F5C9DC8
MTLTLEQVAQLAPDEQVLTSARQLLAVRYWSSLGQNLQALWGLCQGSAVYQVTVDLQQFAYRCNCPSRKRPCRHVIGLLLLASLTPELLPSGDGPAWVNDWLEQRAARRDKASRASETREEKTVDTAARQKRVDQRIGRVRGGVDQLKLWLSDLVRQGLGRPEVRQAEFWENQARRLVDAQAPGLAGRLRSLSEIPSSGGDWPERLLAELGRLILLLHAFDRLEDLEPPLQAEVRQLIGWTVSQQELEQTGEPVSDRWFVLGQRVTDDDRVQTQRSWLLGLESQRTALLLQFAPGSQPFPEFIEPGTVQPAVMIYYPGTSRQRVRLQQRLGDSQPLSEDLPGQQLIADWLDLYAEGLARTPWLNSQGGVLKGVQLSQRGDRWFVRDSAGDSLPLGVREPWELLAESGGAPFDLMAEWNGDQLLPLGRLINGRYRTIDAAAPTAPLAGSRGGGR